MAWYFVQTAFAWAVAHFACVRIEKYQELPDAYRR